MNIYVLYCFVIHNENDKKLYFNSFAFLRNTLDVYVRLICLGGCVDIFFIIGLYYILFPL